MTEKIKFLREKRGLSQEEFSQLSGINLNSIKEFENEVRTLSYPIAKKIAKFFNVSYEYLTNKKDVNLYCSVDFNNLCESDKKIITENIEYLKGKNSI